MTMDDPAGASRLILWFSPAFPTGAFSFSHGLEWAVEAEDVQDRASLQAWIEGVLRDGAGWSDAVLISAIHRAARAADEQALLETAELALALQPSLERRLESTVQGEAFLKAVETGWSHPAIARFREAWRDPIALPVAVGMAAAANGIEARAVLQAYLTGLAANLVSAAIRLAPIGQSDGLRVLSALEPAIAELAARAETATLEDLGGCAIRSDIASMRHETQTTRLFRS
ncbi:urease accessory protein UreF [Labrys miyagiensis]|uniref:Urease accessory protein UreF n=1 Tax=Labrys miyagiensis TaxID=346912 RepID=A0ABQ6CB58_9HYPH|nr:urease accessory protein UreF [Labrys miyagiensis]GLS17621.1 urease accessory protein UreF [Labrys miyagiensis]